MRSTLLVFVLALAIPSALAHCPLCTAAVGTGAVISRFLGLDDMVFGLWVGAVVVSSTMVAARKMKQVFPYQNAVLSAAAVALTVYGLKLADILGDLRYMVFGIDKMVIGIVVGAAVTYVMPKISLKLLLKYRRALFPRQTIVLTVLTLIILSILAQLGAPILLTGS
ncbi:MAG: hypothetical protein PWP76_73 [Candidatus Diapherotrites archaeon]|nr:hypothetical protein [Candidatus Diapherotrites archaeon]